MHTKSLLVIGENAQVAQRAFVQEALDLWPSESRPGVRSVTIREAIADPAMMDHSGVAWVVIDESFNSDLIELVCLLQDRGLPAMLSRREEANAIGTPYCEGITIGPWDAGPVALCAVLQTLWDQAATIHRLKSELAFLQARQAGLSDQFDKMDEELRLASLLQRDFLPAELPEVSGVQIHTLFRPAGYVSGDIYDVARLDDENIGIFMADAVGHGVPAALMTIYIKNSLRLHEVVRGGREVLRTISAGDALERLNRVLSRQKASKMRFPSACYCVLNTQTLELTVARAGAPYPILMRADGSEKWLTPEGSLLGLFPDQKFEMHREVLRPGDRFLLYSDGFELAFPGEAEGDIEPGCGQSNLPFVKELRELGTGCLEAGFKRLYGKLDQQVGSLNQQDDLTAVCIGIDEDHPGPGESVEQAALFSVATD